MLTNPRLLGLLGYNTSYSLSPKLHNKTIQKLRLDCAYVSFDLSENKLSAFLEHMWEVNALGFNVTQPYKKIVANLLSLPQPVNTIYRGKTFWEGTSTDSQGFTAALERSQKKISDFEHIIFLGAGAVTENIYSEIFKTEKFVGSVTFLARQKPTFIHHNNSNWLALTLENFEKVLQLQDTKASLLIQATSATLVGDNFSWLSESFKSFQGAFFDLNYKNLSQLYFDAISRDLLTFDGESMLIEQARAAQKIWWNETLPYDEIKSFL